MSVLAVITTFNPNLKGLQDLLLSVESQADCIILIDNGSAVTAEREVCGLASRFGCKYIFQSDNPGLALAQNEGIEYAVRNGFDYCLFLDQDSCLTDGMVCNLLGGLMSRQECKIAAIGPSIRDACASHPSAPEAAPDQPSGVRAVRLLISSGMMIPTAVLADVGRMDDSLFIDHVDHEWCLRASSKGYALLQSRSAYLHHRLGDSSRRVWLLRWRSIAIHSPARDFYRVRNSILIARRSGLSRRTQYYLVVQSLAVVFFSFLLAPQKLSRLRYFSFALMDGFRNIAGKFGKQL